MREIAKNNLIKCFFLNHERRISAADDREDLAARTSCILHVVNLMVVDVMLRRPLC